MNRLERFETSPMTGSSAQFLAATYGNGLSINEFASTLPQNAEVIDVGAGLSDFGIEVAARRSDISWTNFDLNYGVDTDNNPLLNKLRNRAPDNLTYLYGDALDFPEAMKGHYDRVYSYNLVTHLLRVNRSLGSQALSGMVDLLAIGGELKVGPTNKKMMLDSRWQATTISADATETDIAETERLLTTPLLARPYYKASCSSGVGAYPAKRFSPDLHGKIVFSDDGGQSVHQLISRRGVVLAARLCKGLLRS